MSVKIRLRRMGRRNCPSYRIIVADSRSPRDGRFIETIGHYDPLKEPAGIEVNEGKVKQWLERGAQPSETVRALLSRLGLLKKWRDTEVIEEKRKSEIEGKPKRARPRRKTKEE
jgi:small subunit ribosomal protein S16